MRKWFEIKDYQDRAEVLLYGYIGRDDNDDDAVSASEFIKLIEPYAEVPLDIRVNSGGGSVFDGVAIRSAIQRRKAETRGYIDGWAASAATIITSGCDWLVISEGAQYMVHKSWTGCLGNADDMRSCGDQLDSIDNELAAIYSKRTGKTVEECMAIMKAETFIGSVRALAEGWVDEIDEGEGARKAAFFDLQTRNHIKGHIDDEVLASLEADDTEPDEVNPAAQGAEGAEVPGTEADPEGSEVKPATAAEYLILDSGIYEIKGENQ